MVTTDASVWLSILLERDRFHHQSLRWFEQQVDARREIVAPNLLLVEVSGAIARLTGSTARGHFSAHQIRQTPHVRLLPLDDVRCDLAIQIAAELQIRGADATYVAIANEMGVPLISWDQQQLSRAAELIPAFTPETMPVDS